jgi:DNA-binding PadR family transcriptional regulator
MLHGLERKGYLKSHKKRVGRTYRRFYRATPKGRKALTVVRARLNELFDEVGRKKRRGAKKPDGAATSSEAKSYGTDGQP